MTFSFISCGEQEIPIEGDVSIGQAVEAEADDFLSSAEKSKLSIVCQALRNKVSFFKKFYVNRTKRIEYKVSRRSCSSKIPNIYKFSAKVFQTGGDLFLDTQVQDVFTDILGPNSDMIKDFCQNSNQGGELLRHRVSGSTAVWLHAFDGSTSKCRGSKEDICLKLSTGNKIKGRDSFEIKDVESITVQMSNDGNNNGVVLNRALASSRFCTKKDSREVMEQAFIKVK
jgi:hypothetical protein